MRGRARAFARRAAVVAVVGVALAALAAFTPALRHHVLAATALASIDRNEVGPEDLDAVGSSPRTTYLVVGTDQRHVPSGDPRDIRGERADAIMLWSVDDDGAVAVSIPRDLRVHVSGHGDGKLGGVLEYGPGPVIAAVRELTGRPVHHYVEIEFSGFVTAVDRVGGLTLELEHAVRDPASKLDLPAGAHSLRGVEALAFVRSRTHEELVDGRWVIDGSGDLGRIERQHELLAAVPDAVRRCGVLGCVRMLTDLGGAVTLDRTLTAGQLRDLAAALGTAGAAVTTGVLPTVLERAPEDSMSPFPPAHLGNVGYRRLDQPAARALLDDLLPSSSDQKQSADA
ncbi:MAG: LCP family protein [Dermatophilaceae bacterium]